MDTQTVERLKGDMAEERERAAPPEGFPKLPVVPGGRYTDPEFLALEDKYLWQKSWLYACHTDEVPEAGSFKMWKRTGAPIFIIRGKDDRIRAFYNTCRHRGAPVVREDEGQVSGLFCQYHGWTYDLEGNLINLRDKRDFVDMDMSCLGLVEVRCERLGNWIFVNQDPEADPLLAHLGPIVDHLAHLPLETVRHVHSASYEVDCQVKVLFDAFLEVYHLKSIHPKTVDRFLDHRGTAIKLWGKGHSLMLTPNRREDWVDPGTVGMPEMEEATDLERYNNPSYNFYPNLITPVAPSGIPFLTFWPKGPRKMVVDVHWFAPDWGGGDLPDGWDMRIENFARILDEDLQFAPQIQESVESPGFRGYNLNYQERRIYHWHEELDRRIGIDRIPEHLRVKPVMAPYVDTE